VLDADRHLQGIPGLGPFTASGIGRDHISYVEPTRVIDRLVLHTLGGRVFSVPTRHEGRELTFGRAEEVPHVQDDLLGVRVNWTYEPAIDQFLAYGSVRTWFPLKRVPPALYRLDETTPLEIAGTRGLTSRLLLSQHGLHSRRVVVISGDRGLYSYDGS